MLKIIIIITSILFFLNIILLIPIRVKIGKRMTEEPYLEIRIFNTLIKKMKVVQNNNLNVPKISVWKVLSSYNDDYYQVIIGNNNLGLLFELELTLTLFKFLIAMCKKFKLFLKTIKMGV